MFQFPRFFRMGNDGNHIETNFIGMGEFSQIMPCSLGDFALLERINGLFRVGVFPRFSRFYFRENQGVLIFGNEINFGNGRVMEVFLKNEMSFLQ